MTLEELLNTLIQRGWLPFGEGIDRSPYYNCDVGVYERVHGKKIVRFYSKHNKHPKTLRQLVSKESGLRQFVCENGMVNANDTPEENAINLWRYNKKDLTEWWYRRNYQYRLIESALKNEDKLEQFLLNNIIINE